MNPPMRIVIWWSFFLISTASTISLSQPNNQISQQANESCAEAIAGARNPTSPSQWTTLEWNEFLEHQYAKLIIPKYNDAGPNFVHYEQKVPEFKDDYRMFEWVAKQENTSAIEITEETKNLFFEKTGGYTLDSAFASTIRNYQPPHIVIVSPSGVKFQISAFYLPMKNFMHSVSEMYRGYEINRPVYHWDWMDELKVIGTDEYMSVTRKTLDRIAHTVKMKITNPEFNYDLIDRTHRDRQQDVFSLPKRLNTKIVVNEYVEQSKVEDDFEKVLTKIQYIGTSTVTEKITVNWRKKSDGRITLSPEKFREEQKAILHEILLKIYPDYYNRREWPLAYLAKNNHDAFVTMNNTEYIIIREKTAAEKAGDIINIIGLTSAPYGKKVNFNYKENVWTEEYGPFGRSFKSLFVKTPWQRLSKSAQESKEDNHAFAKSYLSIPMLPAEDSKNILPRPGVLDAIDISPSDPWGHGPTYFYIGVIKEAVKFWSSKERKTSKIGYLQLLKEFYLTLFSSPFGMDFINHGQALYTINDAAGVEFYRRFGFKPVPGYPKKIVEGVEMTYLELTPADIPGVLDSNLTEAEAEKFIKDFMRRVWNYKSE
jgi:hypothetical protein